MTTKTNVFAPLKPKTDRLTHAYIGPDGAAVACFERRTELGRQEYARTTTDSGIRPALQGTGGNVRLRRIVLHTEGAAAVACAVASGRTVTVDAYHDDTSETARAHGYTVQSLYVTARGIGTFRLTDAPFCYGGFSINHDGDPKSVEHVERLTADVVRKLQRLDRYNDTQILTVDDPKSAASAA